ncbi:MAG: bifunctional alpha,alpha-trehalose-phosphate synthase (UDP-forming)/trehalose-phosphatase, partial [Myxococcota bacterium]
MHDRADSTPQDPGSEATGSARRLLLVSNRLPVHARLQHGAIDLVPSVGGLATGLARPHEERGGLWIGWPGDASRMDLAQRQRLDRALAERRLVPVHLTTTEVQRYYEGFSNGVLWPLFHSMPSRMPLECRDWDAYAAVNARFADAVAAVWRPGDLVWVQDYQLMLVPALLRDRVPDAQIGFFLHIPFPPSDIFRVLPRRDQLLAGLLGADQIGFQTFADQRNFLATALRVRGLEAEYDRIAVDGREVRAGVFPIGIDVATFEAAETDPAVTRELVHAAPRREALLLAIDRLDYTKGIPNRLEAFDRLLDRHPRWRGRVRLLQVSVPSREGVSAYKELRKQVDELAGRINGTWSTIGWVPIVPMHRAFGAAGLRALYRTVQVMLVTPLRDGMNLVAKEFVAARTDERGVLVLSEFAGAAAELSEAVLVNPHDIDGMADAFDHALRMPEDEQRVRMRAMRERIRHGDVHRWTTSFLAALEVLPASGAACRPLPPDAPAVTAIATAPSLALLLDYDGTLVPLVADPQAAAPDAALRTLLQALVERAGVEVHVVSGRDADTLDRWLGALPLTLHAEHGALWRRPGGAWTSATPGLGLHAPPVRAAMHTFAARTPGAHVEEKAVGIAWHYRRADVEHGAAAAHELRHHLGVLLANAPVEVLAGNKVVEVRPHGVDKSLALTRVRSGAALLALGDDRTDDDLFAALPDGGV